MRANEYVELKAPWKLAKDEAAADELDETLASLARQLVRQAVYVAPFMPDKAEELWRQLGGKGSVHDQRFDSLDQLDPSGWLVHKGAPLFPKEAPAKATV
jgi:methionyl-tRNA synthetase